MDFVGVGGFVLSVVGTGVSIWSLIVAGGAKKAVADVLEKRDDQVVRDDSRELLNKLNAAREAALIRRGNARGAALAGRSAQDDLAALKQAQDALAITAVSTDLRLEQGLRLASTQLDAAVKEIEGKTGRDGWADALGVLQGVIPKVNTHQRKLGTKALT